MEAVVDAEPRGGGEVGRLVRRRLAQYDLLLLLQLGVGRHRLQDNVNRCDSERVRTRELFQRLQPRLLEPRSCFKLDFNVLKNF